VRDGFSAFYWAATELYPCEFKTLLNSAVGGTSSSHLVSVQIAQLEALPVIPDVVVVQSVQNDYLGTAAHADTAMGNLITYSERALAAGVKLVVLCSRPPKSAVPDVASAWYYMNRRIERYCRNTPGNYYWDTAGYWRATATADTTGVAFRPSIGGLDAFSSDGTHPSPIAHRTAAAGIVPVLQRFARPLAPMINAAVAYDDTNWPYNNLLGADGLMMGTGGQLNGVNNSNVAGSILNDSQNRWEITTENGITATPSIVTGPDGYRYQQIAISGTASADAIVQLARRFSHDVASGTFVGEAMVYANSLTGVRAVSCGMALCGFHDMAGAANIGVGTTRFHFRSAETVGSNSGFGTRTSVIQIQIASGQTVSGNIQVGRVGVFRIS